MRRNSNSLNQLFYIDETSEDTVLKLYYKGEKAFIYSALVCKNEIAADEILCSL